MRLEQDRFLSAGGRKIKSADLACQSTRTVYVCGRGERVGKGGGIDWTEESLQRLDICETRLIQQPEIIQTSMASSASSSFSLPLAHACSQSLCCLGDIGGS